ncbi:MAG: putative manganese transporter [Halofilum sp. (in: g-proteobacteria)]|nr:putative manganese transporter [Halofilum sp. (in: g-proteobacteria)]
MTAAILAAKRGLIDLHRLLRELLSWRVLIPLGLLALAWYAPAAGRIMVDTIAEAYLQVSTFVAGTLALIYGVERVFRFDLAQTLQARPRLQVPIAAFLGALPGCGGAIVVVVQYVNGRVGFGALIAVLTATMGDAAFLLLSQEPSTAGSGVRHGPGRRLARAGLLVDADPRPRLPAASQAVRRPRGHRARARPGRATPALQATRPRPGLARASWRPGLDLRRCRSPPRSTRTPGSARWRPGSP